MEPLLSPFRVTTPWRVTLGDVTYIWQRGRPDVKFLKRMRIGEKDVGRLRRFVTFDKRRVDEEAAAAAKERRLDYIEDSEFCELCNVATVMDNKAAAATCPSCGNSVNRNPVDTSFREGTSLHTTYLYKQESHLTDNLIRVQGRETTDIDPDILEMVTAELDKKGNRTTASPDEVRLILKTLGLSRLYNHAIRIWASTTGQSPPVITREQQAEISHMFNLVQKAWVKVKPAGRSNMLSYSYLLHKLFLLLGYVDLAKHFKLLKSRDKVIAQDAMWRDICRELSFEFMPSFY